MSPSVPQLDIASLTVPQRLDLIGQLWDSIPDPASALDIPEWHRAENDKRVAAADAAPEQAIPWEEVKRGLRSQSKTRRTTWPRDSEALHP